MLELGCGNGLLGSYLGANCDCTVDRFVYDALAKVPKKFLFKPAIAISRWHLFLVKRPGLTPGEKYDAIVSADVLASAADPEVILSTCRSLLTSGGKLILIAPNANYCGLQALHCCSAIFCIEAVVMTSILAQRGLSAEARCRFMEEAQWALEPIEALQQIDVEAGFYGALDRLPPAVARYLLAVP